MECSGVFREAFRARGHDAWSLDLKPSEDNSPFHIEDDIRERRYWDGWDLVVLHPVCTRLTNAGVRWLRKPPEGKTLFDMEVELVQGQELFKFCLDFPAPKVAVENPIQHKYAHGHWNIWCKYDQIVHPWWFGDDPEGPDNVKKSTCWWLKGLPKLTKTGSLDGSTARPDIHYASPGPDRSTERSRSFPGMAKAAAEQWG